MGKQRTISIYERKKGLVGLIEDAKKLGFDFKDGKTKIVIKLSDDNPEIVDY